MAESSSKTLTRRPVAGGGSRRRPRRGIAPGVADLVKAASHAEKRLREGAELASDDEARAALESLLDRNQTLLDEIVRRRKSPR